MQYDAETPEEYFDLLDEDWRKEKLLLVRKYIMKHAPDIEETIQYKMLSYGKGDSGVFGLNAQKSYVSLYVGNIDKVPGGKELLEGINYGKGCIRIRKTIDIENGSLEEFVKRAIVEWEAGRDVSC